MDQNMDCFVDTSAYIENMSMGSSCRIYKGARVINCKMGDHVAINDFTVAQESNFEGRNTMQRNNAIYNSKIGRYTYTGRNTHIWHAEVGAFCSISWNVSIGGANHDYTKITTHSFLYSKDFGIIKENPLYDRFVESCIIGNDVWIGSNAVICRGVTIGNGAVIGAGAIVTKDVDPYTIVIGVPARPLKKRFSDEIIVELQKCQWWNLPPQALGENLMLFNSEPTVEVIQEIKKLCMQNGAYNLKTL